MAPLTSAIRLIETSLNHLSIWCSLPKKCIVWWPVNSRKLSW